MNKGIGKATRSYLLFLNSGDCFNGSDALARLMAGGQGEDLVFGDLLLESDGVRRLRTYPDTLTFDHFRTTSLPHPCTLIRRALLASMQGYDESVPIVADWVFFMNAICLHGASYRHVAHPISVFTTDGLSSLPANQALVQRERLAALQKYYGAFLPDYEQHDAQVAELQRFWCRAGRKIDRVARKAWGPRLKGATGA